MQRSLFREFATFPDILVMTGLSVCGWVFTFWHAPDGRVWVGLVAGMAAYAVMEYVTHRFLFHRKPPKRAWLLRFLKRIHYDHHVDPSNLKLLFLPVWYSLPNIAAASAICALVTRSGVATGGFVTGICTFLLYYEWTHYRAHRPIRPITPWGRWMKKVHLWHHFKNENYWFGVTHPGMDVLLGTWADERSVPRSQTARDLEHRMPTDVDA